MRAQKKNKRLETELRELDAFLSHVLRSYMISICGFASLLSEEVKQMRRGTGKENMRKIEQNIRELDASIESALRQIRSTFSVRTHNHNESKGRVK